MQYILIVTITTIIITISTDIQWTLPELFPLGLCTISIVKTVALTHY